jgi:hypothetical protein
LARVADRVGDGVTDLKQDDFSLFDSGKPRDIKVFTMDRSDRQKPPAPIVAPDNPAEHLFTNTQPDGLDRPAR